MARSGEKNTEKSNADIGIRKKGKIRAEVSDFEHGLRSYENVELVRIKSATYSILIMDDYYPSIGHIDGSVELIYGEGLVNFGNIEGFYMIRKNSFSMIIERYKEKKKEKGNEVAD